MSELLEEYLKTHPIDDPWLDEPWTEEELRLLEEAERSEGIPWDGA